MKTSIIKSSTLTTPFLKPIKEKELGPINLLPPELLLLIFSFLDTYASLNVRLVQKEWNINTFTLDKVKKEQVELIEKLTDLIGNNLDKIKCSIPTTDKLEDDKKPHVPCQTKYADVIKSSVLILNENKIVQSKTLLDVKESLLATRKLLLPQLEKVEEKDLRVLNQGIKIQKIPLFLGDAPLLAIIDKIWKIRDSSRQSEALYRIVQEFLALDQPKNALNLAVKIQSDTYRHLALFLILRAYLASDLLDKALQVAEEISSQSMSGENDKSLALKEIAEAYAEKGMISESLKIAEKIPNKEWRSQAFAKLSEIFLRKGFFEAAEIAAEKVTSSFTRADLLRDIKTAQRKKELGW